MKITIAGSLGNISRPLSQLLVSAGHELTIISSSIDRRAEIEAAGARAAIGSVSDADFLTGAFKGADAVYTMTPPMLGGSNIVANTISAGEALTRALKTAATERVVMLSSLGAEFPAGNGPIAGLHHIEQLFGMLDSSVTFLRAAYFYINFYGSIPMIKGLNILGGNYPGTTLIPMVHPEDIAVAAAEELQKTVPGKKVRYIASDVRTASDIAAVLGKAAGKPQLPWVEFTDEQALQGMQQAGLPAEVAALYTEMGDGFRAGIIQQDFLKAGSPVTGAVKLEEFAQEFAAAYQQS